MRKNPQRRNGPDGTRRTRLAIRVLALAGTFLTGSLLAGLAGASLSHSAASTSAAGSPFAGLAKPIEVPHGPNVASPGIHELRANDWMPRVASNAASPTLASTPGCSGTACPMGVVDYGIKGSLSTYSYNTTMVEAFADVSALTVTSGGTGCLEPHASYCMGIQSNWIDNNVYLKNHHRQFWTQDVAQIAYDASCSSPCVSKTYSVTWLDNIWNFSYAGGYCPTGKGLGCVNTNDLTGNGTGRCTSYGGQPTFYYCVGSTTYGLKMPFTLWSFMSTGPGSALYGPSVGTTSGSWVDFYGGIVQNNSIVSGGYYDSVIFKAGSLGAGSPSWLVKNAKAPSGLPFDGEWVMCGPSNGASVTMGSAAVLLESLYYSPSATGFVSIRHAWSSGYDTAESVTNGNVYAFSGLRDVGSEAAGTINPQTSLW